MSDLVVTVFNDEFKAEEVRLDLRKKEEAHLVDVEDSVVLVRDKEGKVKLHHMSHFTIGGAMGGGFLGTLFGVLLLNPVFAILGLATGVVVGGVSGAMSHIGINEDFIVARARALRFDVAELLLARICCRFGRANCAGGANRPPRRPGRR